VDVNIVNNTSSPSVVSANGNIQQPINSESLAANNLQNDNSKAATYEDSKGNMVDTSSATPIDKKKAQQITDQLNNFMETVNTDIRFKLNDQTKTFVVDVVDQKTGKVLRECPSHEFFEMIAGLKEYLGALVDKKI